jgi:glycosyltransferase involved in cell wall biosynthesis
MTPRISIVIPTYNRAADLRWALRSVLAQTFAAWECVIVDNHSTDDTDAVVAEFADPRLKLVKIHNEGAVAASRNLGVEQSGAEYVAFLDSDDWWNPEKLELSLQHLDRGAALVYHDLYIVDERRSTRFWRKSSTRTLCAPVFDDLLGKGNAINLSSVVVRRDLMQRIAGFSTAPELIAIEDYDAWLRIARLSEAFERIPRTLGYYLVAPGSLSNPARTIAVHEALEQRYASDIERLGGMQWLAYTKARANYLLGRHEQARAEFAAIDWRGTPLGLRARGLLTKLQMTLGGRA